MSGAYRKIIEIPTNLSWKIMRYKEKHDNLILSDIDEMRKCKPPQDEPGKLFSHLSKILILNNSFLCSTIFRREK